MRIAILLFCCLLATGYEVMASVPKVGHKTHRKSRVAKEWSPKPFVNGHYVLSKSIETGKYQSNQPVVVIVDKGSHFTYVLQLQGDKIVRILRISNTLGTDATPTPPGRYIVASRRLYPVWVPPKNIDPEQKPVPPYNQTRKNPLGVAVLTLNKFDIALHGTNSTRRLRQNLSHGCVRHSNNDMFKLYSVVKPGSVVYIVNQWRGKVLSQRDFVRR